jgi:hypothetical protein
VVLGRKTVVLLQINTEVIKKMALERWEGRGDGMKGEGV